LVGDILKNRREELGQDLREISNTLKIKYDYLKAIEDGTLENLPQEVYVKGYIREYAEHLRIDPEAAINAYVQQISPPQVENKDIPEKEPEKRKIPKIGYVLISLLFILITITVAYTVFSHKGKDINRSAEQTQKEISSPYAEPMKKTPFSSVVKPGKTTLSDSKKETPLASTETKKEIVPPKSDVSRQVLEVFATDTTWLLVLIDKTDPKEMLLKPGDSAKWHAKNCFSLKIGNAGGIRLVFNGKEIKKLGEKGQVINIDLPSAGI
jgi:cytoskeletal protein RodZ